VRTPLTPLVWLRHYARLQYTVYRIPFACYACPASERADCFVRRRLASTDVTVVSTVSKYRRLRMNCELQCTPRRFHRVTSRQVPRRVTTRSPSIAAISFPVISHARLQSRLYTGGSCPPRRGDDVVVFPAR